MGTNFYLMSKNKKFIREYFAVEKDYGFAEQEYEIVDEPYLGYCVHLNKLSLGWRPLFQSHKTIKSFKELEQLCLSNKSIIGIYDEYGKKYSWEQYYKRVYNHSQRAPEPFKWVYDIDTMFGDNHPTLHTIRCAEEEAELYLPFNHKIYMETEMKAKERFKVYRREAFVPKYWEDPDYPFDWTEGEFS